MDKKSLITLGPGHTFERLFSVIYKFLKCTRMFVLGKPFQPSLMFAGKVSLSGALFLIGSGHYPQTLLVFNFRAISSPYPLTLDKAGKASQGQTL